jgi:hypothetical protein
LTRKTLGSSSDLEIEEKTFESYIQGGMHKEIMSAIRILVTIVEKFQCFKLNYLSIELVDARNS